MNSLGEFFPVLVFVVAAVAFTLIPVVIAYFLAPRTTGAKTLETYECGIEPFGSAWMRYSMTYYFYALIFVAFDVDVLYLFPTAVSYTRGGRPDELYAVIAFVGILALAILYAWGKGVFRWKRKNDR